MGQFGVGQGLRRVEDARFLTGHGRYTDDIDLPNMSHAVLVRSPHAHADIVGLDIEEALQSPGVLGIYTIADLDADEIGDIPCLTPLPSPSGDKPVMTGHPVLARHRVRHVGDPVVLVVAETPGQARDAADLVMVDYEELPSVVDTAAALSPDAPQLYEQAPNNQSLHWWLGDSTSNDAAFAKAAKVVTLDLVNNRVVANSMEPRNAIGDYDPENDRLTLHTSSQGVFNLRNQLAEHILKIPPEKLRVQTPDVGGGFGMKIFLYPEQVLTLWAARKLHRPVKWNGERGESFQTDTQGRDHVSTIKLGLDENGKFLALRIDTIANLGAYLSNFSLFIPTAAGSKMLSGLYSIPSVYVGVRCVFTNTVPVDAYRGAGRPEAAYAVERMVDTAAREIGVTPDELRRRNLIRPDQLPYDTATGISYDSGNFVALMEESMRRADWAGAQERKAAAAKRGKLLGIGMASYVEACSGFGSEQAKLRLDQDGGITVYIGTMSNGQGHATAYAQLIADQLGVTPDKVRLRQGDSDELSSGGGTGGSRSLLMGGCAIHAAGEKLIERAKALAGQILETADADLEFDEGTFTVVGTDRRITLDEIAAKSHAEGGPNIIEEIGAYDAPPMTYPNGSHICELEVDEATGTIEILRYTVVDDFGKIINPLLAAGQVHGGLAQGVGQALLEETVYDDHSGQLITGSFMDYNLPRAANVPFIDLTLVEDTPCVTNPMGIKGAGEAGAIGAPPAVINAVVDALSPLGVRSIDMPATPEKVWRAIQTAKASAARAAE
jgi:carbon-monoxide dehydrogenase large subunit